MARCPVCETKARKKNAAERAAGEREGKPDRNGRIVHFSDEERQRRSELAKRLRAEGKFGGAAVGRLGGQSISRHRITDSVLENFRQPEKQDLVIKAIESALKSKSKALRLRAAESVMRTEAQQDERMSRDRGGAVDPSSLNDEQLLELVAQGVEALLASGDVPTGFIDATAEDADVEDMKEENSRHGEADRAIRRVSEE
jgi:hypothetical protein